MEETLEAQQEAVRQHNKKLAEAKGKKTYYEHYRKVHKALLMKEYEPMYPTAAAQEREAYADSRYLKTLEQLAYWTQECEVLSLERADLEHRFEAWRTRQANKRAEMSRYGA